MEQSKIFTTLFLVLLLSSSLLASSTTTITQRITYKTFIIRSCTSTTYPNVCLRTLLPYATVVKSNPYRLVNAALSAALESSNATLSVISQLYETEKISRWEAAIVKDCIGDIKDSMDEIKDSLEEISGIYRSNNKRFAISNAQTWTSAAITDEDSCLDGFSEGKISASIKNRIRNSIVSLARVSSNALSLINHLTV